MLLSSQFAYTATTLNWLPPTTNSDGSALVDLSGYSIYYGATSGHYTNSIDVGNVTTYTFTNLPKGTYYFVVAAYDSARNQSVNSNEIAKTEADSSVPTVDAFTIPSASSSLTFNISSFAASDDVGVTGYLINESSEPPGPAAPGWSAAIPASYTAASSGTHTLYAWAKDGAGNVSTSRSATITITLPSQTDFTATPTSGPNPLTVTFTDRSAGGPSLWLWDFGDGHASTLQNPVHTYASAGSFTVSLTATGIGGAVIMTKSNYISVNACGYGDIRIKGTSYYYPTIQDAYNARANGDTIMLHAQTFTENLTLQNNTLVKLQGGYNCDYTSDAGFTTIVGKIDVSEGTITLDRVIMR
jgi:PKD repeat protein